MNPSERPAAVKLEEGAGDAAPMDHMPLVHEELYDLDNDPHEHHDLLPQAPPILDGLRQQLAAWTAASSAALPPPTINPADRERLRALGYVE